MNSGILGTLLHQLPYQFRGLHIISTIFFILGLVLYIFFSVVYIIHFAIYRRQAYDELIGSVAELCLFPCWSISFMTLVSFVTLVPSNAPWGGQPFTILAHVKVGSVSNTVYEVWSTSWTIASSRGRCFQKCASKLQISISYEGEMQDFELVIPLYCRTPARGQVPADA